VEVENIGSGAFKDYRLDVAFPKDFMVETYGAPQEETDTHKVIRRVAANFPKHPNGLFPSDTHKDDLVRYFVASEHFMPRRTGRKDLMQLPVQVTLFADAMIPQTVIKPIKELQDFR
jgi:hypothetical protein